MTPLFPRTFLKKSTSFSVSVEYLCGLYSSSIEEEAIFLTGNAICDKQADVRSKIGAPLLKQAHIGAAIRASISQQTCFAVTSTIGPRPRDKNGQNSSIRTIIIWRCEQVQNLNINSCTICAAIRRLRGCRRVRRTRRTARSRRPGRRRRRGRRAVRRRIRRRRRRSGGGEHADDEGAGEVCLLDAGHLLVGQAHPPVRPPRERKARPEHPLCVAPHLPARASRVRSRAEGVGGGGSCCGSGAVPRRRARHPAAGPRPVPQPAVCQAELPQWRLSGFCRCSGGGGSAGWQGRGKAMCRRK
jgi:hypothetical protein